jgi:hypothetical protein
MKTETKTLWSLTATGSETTKKLAELVEVYLGNPSKMIGYAIIQNGDHSNGKFIEDYEDAVRAVCNVYCVEEDTVYRSASFARLTRIPTSEDREIQSFYDHLERLGFTITHTGGGCTAFYKEWNVGTKEPVFIMVSQEANAEIDREYLEELGISVGLYANADMEGEYFLTHEVGEAVAQIEILCRLMDSKLFTVTQ